MKRTAGIAVLAKGLMKASTSTGYSTQFNPNQSPTSSSSSSTSTSSTTSEEESYSSLSPNSSTLASSIIESSSKPSSAAGSVNATAEDDALMPPPTAEDAEEMSIDQDNARTTSTTTTAASADTAPSSSTPFSHPNPPPHVDIVSYPSADLLRLLASLLDQIARANDALNLRNSSHSTSNLPPSTISSPPPPSSTEPQQRHERESSEETSNNFERGRFDAAPLNSPVTPRRPPLKSNGSTASFTSLFEEQQELPVTPGIDLLREVGAAGGAEGFFPSLGGAHTPVPLRRRRGSSFQDKREGARPRLGSEGTVGGKQSSSSSFSSSSNPSTSNSTAGLAEEPPLTSLLTASSMALSSPSATLCFHARNIPAITIEAYLLRILKYCPTTNEVFLALLVYFDRMARVGLEAQRVGLTTHDGVGGGGQTTERLFAIDSFNVHRLVIAGVTVASKFFSDVFYTNSRYAKVCNFPLLFSFPLFPTCGYLPCIYLHRLVDSH